MPRHSIAAGCGWKGCSLHKFPQDEVIKRSGSSSREATGMGHCLTHWCAQSILLTIVEGIRFCDEMEMPTTKHLKPDAEPTIFARSIEFIQPSNTSNTIVLKPSGRPLSEK